MIIVCHKDINNSIKIIRIFPWVEKDYSLHSFILEQFVNLKSL